MRKNELNTKKIKNCLQITNLYKKLSKIEKLII